MSLFDVFAVVMIALLVACIALAAVATARLVHGLLAGKL